MSETFIGRQISFGVAVEGDRGTAEATAAHWVQKTTADVIPQVETVIDDSTFGRLEDAARSRTVRKWNEGQLAGVLHADVAGYFFTNIYGDVDSNQLATGVHEHDFSLQQTITHPTLTLFVKDAEVRNTKIANGVVSQFEIQASTDDYVRYTADFIGKQEEASTDTPTLTVENDWVSRDITLKFAVTEGGLTGADAVDAKELTLTWNANAEADFVFGDYSPANVHNKQLSIEGSFTRNYVDQTFEDLYKSKESRYMLVDIIGEENLGGANNPQLTLKGYRVEITDWSRSSAGNDLVTEDVSFKLFYNPTDEAQSDVRLVNKTEEYVVTGS